MKKLLAITGIIVLVFFNSQIATAKKNQKLHGKLIISENEADPNYIFSEPPGMVVDRDGNVFLLDSLRGAMMKYDRDGKFLKRFGGKGRGPGEFGFAMPTNIFGDKIFIYDINTWHLFTTDGKFVRTTQLGESPMFPKFLPDYQFIAIGLEGAIKRNLNLYNEHGRFITNIKSLEFSRFKTKFAHDQPVVYDFFIEKLVFTTDSLGRVIYAVSDEYKIWKYENGKSSLLISEDVTPLKLAKSEELLKNVKELKNKLSKHYDKILPLPDFWNVILKINVDEEDNIWVYTCSKERWGFVKYSKDGKFLGFYEMNLINKNDPRRIPNFAVRGNSIYYKLYDNTVGVKVYRADIPKENPNKSKRKGL